MHLVVDELLTKEQLNSPKRYIYELSEMYGWELPELVTSSDTTYTIKYEERNEGRAKIRRRLILDGCRRLGTAPEELTVSYNCCIAVIPKYDSSVLRYK